MGGGGGGGGDYACGGACVEKMGSNWFRGEEISTSPLFPSAV